MPDSATWLSELREPVGAVLPAVPDEGPGSRRVVLFGPPGIGRTTAAGALARRLGRPVLRLAPGPQDAPVPWTGLLELALALQPLPAAYELAAAVDGAAGAEPADASLRLRRLATALLREVPPLTLVVDNAQWLDPASAAVLRWALRLVPELPVIATERSWRPGTEGHWSGEDARAVRVPPLTVRQLSSVLAPHRHTLRQVGRIHRCSGGNPALALALAETADPGTDPDGEDGTALPPAARRLVDEWLGTVSEEARELLALAALDDRPDRELLARLAGPAAGTLLA
ncbi:ATP-binding protein, partial [Kitasatospora sp. NPDC057198]|uniref:ATP-binding protein n=1 Tax=Kitasatospora sp. NPDC057198 TaxID=3346046 RepID=UPI0036329ECC